MSAVRVVLVLTVLLLLGIAVPAAIAQTPSPQPLTCPNGTTQINVESTFQILVTGSPQRSYNVNLPAGTTSGSLLVNSMVGHPEQGCQPGTNGEPGPWCDQGQTGESFNVSLAGATHNVPDHGEDQFQQFSFAYPSLSGGAQTVVFDHTDDPSSPNSVDYTAALCVVVQPPGGGGEGCTPGYWKQRQHLDSWVGYSPNQSFSSVFGVGPNISLRDALGAGGGGATALGRHAVAALLNAASGGVDYEFTVADVIAKVQAAYASGNFESQKNEFERENQSGCPLN